MQKQTKRFHSRFDSCFQLRFPLIGFILLFLIIGDTASGRYQEQAPPFEQIATVKLSEFQALMQIKASSTAELRKISPDYALMAQLKEVSLLFKRPDKLRLESKIGKIIVNGAKRSFQVPQIGLRKVDDQGLESARRLSMLDLGMITTDALSLVRATPLGTEQVDGRACVKHLLELNGGTASRYTIWSDVATKTIVQREWKDDQGNLRASFRYSDVKEVSPGVWVPMKMEVRNPAGAIAATTQFSNVRVNHGIEDDQFTITP